MKNIRECFAQGIFRFYSYVEGGKQLQMPILKLVGVVFCSIKKYLTEITEKETNS